MRTAVAAALNRLCRVALLGAAGALALPAAAQWSPQELRAQQAQAELSARYAAIWSSLDGELRRDFAADQRRWINVTRWDQQRDCLARRSLQDEATAADCLADVTLAHLRTLSATRLASR